jgi:hypothetical protein
VRALFVVTVPTRALCILSVRFEIRFSVAVVEHVVLAGHVENFPGVSVLQDLVDVVELFRFGEVDVAGMQHELGLRGQAIDLVDRSFQGTDDICVCRCVEARVVVADLNESEIARFGLPPNNLSGSLGNRDAAAHGPHQSSARPRHALEKPSAGRRHRRAHLQVSERALDSYTLLSFVVLAG